MSVQRRKFRVGEMECGYDMSDVSLWTHLFGFVTLVMVLLFSYAALLEEGTLTAITGFAFGFGFLLLIYGHNFDRFYFHIGEKVKIGGDAFDPKREKEYIPVEEEEEQYRR